YRSRGVRAVRPFLHRSRYLCAVLLSVLSTGAAAWRPPPGPAHREELSEHVEIAGPAQLNELVAAAATDSAAALALARIYERGEGVTADRYQALLWRRRAAELGNTSAQLDLANRYAYGRGAPHDPREAQVWYRRAAHAGSAEAQFALGRVLVEGRGAAPDAVEGRRWIQQAARNGSAEAARYLERPSITAKHSRDEAP